MLHDKKYFYKYVTAETVLLILKNRTLKYSSPFLFNDPFDTQTQYNYDFEISELSDKYAEELYRLIHLEDKPDGIDGAPLLKDIQELWQKVKIGSIKIPNKDDYMRTIRTGMLDEITMGEQIVAELNTWWISQVKASKVFCVTEEHDNLLMWAHYAEDHKGSVIKFECVSELDNPLCAARKVEYVEKPPVIGTLSGVIKHLTGQESHTSNPNLFYDMYLSKSQHWAYEKEWRVFIPPASDNPTIPLDKDSNEILYEYLQLHPREIHSIYFGCRMDEDEKEEIKKSLTGDFENVKKYNCIKSQSEYKLEFEQIGV